MLTYYKYPNTVLPLDPSGAYFHPYEWEAHSMVDKGFHNQEWMIIYKIMANDEGFFDFSKNLLDIGAFNGIYSFCLDFQHCYMFEPNRERFFVCHANMLLQNRHLKCDIYNCAVSDNNGTIKFDGFNSGELADEHAGKSYDVPCIVLDSMKDKFKNIGLIKIDIEGHEPQALNGMESIIRENNFPPILYESWPPDFVFESAEHWKKRTSELDAFFNKMGYRTLWQWGDYETHLAIHD